jgi:hypothetical protein
VLLCFVAWGRCGRASKADTVLLFREYRYLSRSGVGGRVYSQCSMLFPLYIYNNVYDIDCYILLIKYYNQINIIRIYKSLKQMMQLQKYLLR